MKTLGRHERVCIQAALDVAKRVDVATPELELVKSVRATFWEAVRKGMGDSPQNFHALLDVYEHPHIWEAGIETDAAVQRAAHYAQKEALLRDICKTAFLNAATTLPIAIYNPAIRRLLISLEVANGADAGLAHTDVVTQLSLGHEYGLLPGMPTGLLKHVCLAVDSSHFLCGSFTKYLEESYMAGPAREKTFFKCFHANMTAWTQDSARSFSDLMGMARSAWPSACPSHLAGSVSHWMWQRVAFKTVAEAALPIDVDAVMLKCSSESRIALVESRAANWDDTDEVEVAACIAAYGPTEQWSYYRAVVEFYAALRTDTDLFAGVFNATRFLKELAVHRGFVVSRSMYRRSLTLHGVSDVDLGSAVCNDVYAVMAAQRLH